MVFPSSACRALLVAACVLAVAGCATTEPPRPAPELLDRVPFPFTEGVPQERPQPPLRADGLQDDEINTVSVYRDRIRGVVNITTLSAYRTRFGRPFPDSGTGSGFIIDQRGTVVTNHHVVERGQRLIVTLYDGSLYRAEVVGTDPELDLAVLRFDPQGRELTTLPRGRSDELQVGQSVYALGNPFGLEGTLTTGVVSALNRPVQTGSGFIMRDLVQTDAAINPGNSGGPLLDSRGRVIAVNTMMVSPGPGSVGIGLAVPVNAVDRVVGQILREGRVTRGWIDVRGLALTPSLASAGGLPVRQGILVTHVQPGSEAEAAGLRGGDSRRQVRHGPHRVPMGGDVIVAVNGEPTTSVAELFASLEATQPDDEATVTVLRNGERRQVTITLSARPGTQGK
ncbi:trypsin-like peptidase domain-containing protein [Aquisalimonas sp.]|uniref:S1C family serine protease n=1 Tax=unclassified Aquisalimonas TaxID=2644645 RepID=UPI0025BC6D97|nr:trypsin-like peptidase domain-containing protein [Aquisalimonas sp.]